MTSNSAKLAPRLCPACLRTASRFRSGPNGRPDASCPYCGSLERHRFLAMLLEGLAPAVASARVVLDIAPSRQTTTRLRRLSAAQYVRMDVDPDADKRAVDVQASMTSMPFPDGAIDFAVCYHVLEHIPDDAAAMAELRRVLSDGGIALLQVPWRPAVPTDEDPTASIAKRIRRFGQADHVRYYGSDFESRMERAGLSWLRITPVELLGRHAVQLFHLSPHESVWIARRRHGKPPSKFDATTLRHSLIAAFVDHIVGNAPIAGLDGTRRQLAAGLRRATERAESAERRAATWERRYRQLRGRLPVRILASAAHPGRTLRRLLRRA
jgi:SAM-dependent methyltransferase